MDKSPYRLGEIIGLRPDKGLGTRDSFKWEANLNHHSVQYRVGKKHDEADQILLVSSVR